LAEVPSSMKMGISRQVRSLEFHRSPTANAAQAHCSAREAGLVRRELEATQNRARCSHSWRVSAQPPDGPVASPRIAQLGRPALQASVHPLVQGCAVISTRLSAHQGSPAGRAAVPPSTVTTMATLALSDGSIQLGPQLHLRCLWEPPGLIPSSRCCSWAMCR
jgi:hypothetical protein